MSFMNFLPMILVGIALVTGIVVYYKKMVAPSSKPSSKKKDIVLDSGENVNATPALLAPDDIKDQLAPDGANPNLLNYFYLCDCGHDVYIRSFYIDTMPKRTVFASTFASLFNTPRVTSSVFIVPMVEGTAGRLIDRKITQDQTEVIAAEKSGDRNRMRKMQQSLERDEMWATEIETGNNKLYEAGFLFSLRADTLEKLDLACSDFVSLADESGIKLTSCFGMQSEAYLSNSPCNQIYSGALGIIKSLPIKMHPLDKYGIASIFNHTNNFFTHPTGVPVGRNMFTGEAIHWDAYAQSHNGFSAAFVGKTGTGKSCTIKILASRLENFGYRFACIDTEKSGGRGEYAQLCDVLGGINFQLKTSSENRLNIFEVDEQLEHDDRMNVDVRALHLADKVADVRNILMTAIIGTKSLPDFSLAVPLEKILTDCINELYASKGIVDGNPDSLYTMKGNQKVRKDLPVMSECYLWIMKHRRDNANELHTTAYQVLADSLSDFVDRLYLDEDTFERISREEYDERLKAGEHVKFINGTKGYFDGQSSMHITRQTPFINVDISDLPKDDKLIGQQVAMNFLIENYIKKNSENVKNAQRIVLIVDEAHRMFPYEVSRRFLSDQVRTARKNNASMWICTQAHKDFDVSEETRSILKNVSSIFMLKQDSMDADYLRQNTILTDSMVNRVISLGGDPNDINDKAHKGEVCLIDMDKVIFMKVKYLEETEALFAETDVSKQQLLIETQEKFSESA